MYFCRVLEGQAKPGQAEAAIKVLQDRLDQIRLVSGFLFVEVMQEGDEFIAVSSWKTRTDLQGYANSALAQNLLKDLTPLCVAPPRTRVFNLRFMVESDEGFFTKDEGGEG